MRLSDKIIIFVGVVLIYLLMIYTTVSMLRFSERYSIEIVYTILMLDVLMGTVMFYWVSLRIQKQKKSI